MRARSRLAGLLSQSLMEETMKFKKTEVLLFLLGSLTLLAALVFSLHPTTGSTQLPIITVADGGQPPPPLPKPPIPWNLHRAGQGTPVSVADGGQPPPPIPPKSSTVALPA
jgi:hypothetical protein